VNIKDNDDKIYSRSERRRRQRILKEANLYFNRLLLIFAQGLDEYHGDPECEDMAELFDRLDKKWRGYVPGRLVESGSMFSNEVKRIIERLKQIAEAKQLELSKLSD